MPCVDSTRSVRSQRQRRIRFVSVVQAAFCSRRGGKTTRDGRGEEGRPTSQLTISEARPSLCRRGRKHAT
eukprot:2772251-Lingulodinium_polyedra.AAC.1